jgi:hypothetical protein
MSTPHLQTLGPQMRKQLLTTWVMHVVDSWEARLNSQPTRTADSPPFGPIISSGPCRVAAAVAPA